MMRTSPRASTDLNTLAASDGAPSAEPAPIIVCDLVDEQDQVRPLLDLADDVLDAILEHAAQHRAGDHRVHLQVDDLAVAQADRHASRARTRCGAPALRRSRSCRRRARRSASPSWRARGGRGSRAPAASRGRGRRPAAILSWRASRFRLVAKCLRNGGSSNRFFSRSSRSSLSRIRVAMRETSASGSMPCRRMIDTGMPWRLLEDRREQVGRLRSSGGRRGWRGAARA